MVAAAGHGERMGADKLFLPLQGKPVLQHTLERVTACGSVGPLVVAVREAAVDAVRGLVADMGLQGAKVVPGGARRQDSVARALQAVEGTAPVVLVHDGARPLVTPALVARVASAVRPGAGAAAALPVADTLHRVQGARIAGSFDRAGCWAAQTPQAFDLSALLQAVAWGAERLDWTDEAGLFAAWGGTVEIVPGEATNLKLTVPEDLVLARAVLGATPEAWAEQRVGHGWDVHRLVPGRDLVLGGVPLRRADGLGLEGHSDADALAHAIADAVLGAANLGDIGTHFPPEDPAYAGADSVALLGDVVRLVRSQGWEVANVDATVIADAPRLAPVRAAMRARLATALELAVDRVSVKATTSEGLEPRAISAHAVALLVRGRFG